MNENTIDKAEAIAIIRKEYLCVDRDCDIERSCGKCDLMMPSKEPLLEAYKMALKALEQEPSGDAIDRAEAIKIASGYCHPANVAKELAKLPAVNPQPKTGRWVSVGERLPEEYGEYLITWTTSQSKRPFIGISEGEVTSEYDHEHNRFKFEWLLEDYVKNYPDVKVIAWMPLPKPYESQERSDKE